MVRRGASNLGARHHAGSQVLAVGASGRLRAVIRSSTFILRLSISRVTMRKLLLFNLLVYEPPVFFREAELLRQMLSRARGIVMIGILPEQPLADRIACSLYTAYVNEGRRSGGLSNVLIWASILG